MQVLLAVGVTTLSDISNSDRKFERTVESNPLRVNGPRSNDRAPGKKTPGIPESLPGTLAALRESAGRKTQTVVRHVMAVDVPGLSATEAGIGRCAARTPIP
ncbi:hypothetical protein GCM10010383_07200 [Streptomyces lomondensis]|uniref:Transposase n=1 Tax=Streptomyces lomondensis TaxID=68229 RepID=A0ABQ2WW63_9ACTN|nr:hypothetical protein GCM10010383_07200 [Streptomyces lomondensis]